MTVKEFAQASVKGVILKIVKNGETMICFDSVYRDCITDDVMDSEIESFEIETMMMKKPEVTLNLVDETNTEPGPEEEPEPDDGDDGDEDPDDEEEG